jgi:predicted DNA-binding transcriptional regulator AlpA
MSHSDLVLYTAKDLQRLFGMSRSSLYRMLNRENFPKPVVLGPADSRGGAIRWRSDEVHAYIETLPREKSGAD